jgi:anti-sigma factor RsiW
MNSDDDSLLSAYLDGQLDAELQQVFESALISDPRLSEKLRRLSRTRDLVAGLSRDAPVDLRSAVMRRIRRRAWLRTLLAPSLDRSMPASRWMTADALLGVAAVVLIAFGMTFAFRLLPVADAPVANSEPTIASHLQSPTVPQSDAPPVSQPSSVSPALVESAPGALVSSDRLPDDGLQKADGTSTAPELEQVRHYLDNPRLRHFFLVADLDGTAQRQVASVVEQTTRFNYYTITVAQGIVIDPRHPDQATVFTLVVNPRELETLRQRLRTALRDRVEESTVDPRIVTQLADLGNVNAHTPAPMGDVVIPRDGQLAIRQETGEFSGANPDLARRATPEQERSSPAADLARFGAGDGTRSTVEGARGLVGAAAGDLKPYGPAAAGQVGPTRLAVGRHDSRAAEHSRAPAGPSRGDDENVVVLVWVSRTRPG